MYEPLLNIAICMLLCFVGWGSYRFLLHQRGITYTRHFVWTTLYFLCVAGGISLVFWKYVAGALAKPSPLALCILVVFVVFQIIFYITVPAYLPRPTGYLQTHPDRYYLDIQWRRLVSKSADIVAQQVFIVLLVVFLQHMELSLVQIIFWFTFLFALLHIPLIASERGAWPSWLFAGAVLCFGVTFPIVILYVPYGFVYTYSIHWLLYMLMALFFWMWYSKRAGV